MLPRVRFAPSPTGIPHIGNTRTALFNFLFAKHHQGKFILRIEDTDRSRLQPESLPKILAILKTAGIVWDEGPDVGGPYGPYVQSERLKIYEGFAKKLYEKGKAYPCFCAAKELENQRQSQSQAGKIVRYDRRCLKLSKKEIEEKIKKGEKYCLRLKVPDNKEISWQDLIQGKITFNTKVLDDQVLLKSDGYPTYHLAVVVDDYLMKITHILRGAEWISSTPKHLLLYEAFGFQPPEIGHLPVILGPDKKKLSKRHGAKSILDYEKEGFLPEALTNFMVFLGWSYKDNSDILSLADLIKIFDLQKVRKANPIFDLKKLLWFNRQHILRKSPDELLKLIINFAPKNTDKNLLREIIPLVRERLGRLSDFKDYTEFFFKDLDYPENWLREGSSIEIVREELTETTAALKKLKKWAKVSVEEALRNLVTARKWQPAQFFMLLRIAVTGKKITPPLFESMKILGREKTVNNLEKALKKL